MVVMVPLLSTQLSIWDQEAEDHSYCDAIQPIIAAILLWLHARLISPVAMVSSFMGAKLLVWSSQKALWFIKYLHWILTFYWCTGPNTSFSHVNRVSHHLFWLIVSIVQWGVCTFSLLMRHTAPFCCGLSTKLCSWMTWMTIEKQKRERIFQW